MGMEQQWDYTDGGQHKYSKKNAYLGPLSTTNLWTKGSLLHALFTFLTDTMTSKMTCEAENVDASQRNPLLCLSRHFEKQVVARSFPSYQSGRTAPRVKQAACIIMTCLSIKSCNCLFFCLYAVLIQFRSFTKISDKSRSIMYWQAK
jgi:hypothetical protein